MLNYLGLTPGFPLSDLFTSVRTFSTIGKNNKQRSDPVRSPPEPDGFRSSDIPPAEAFYHEGLREFLLPYDVVRETGNPDDILLAFLQSTYEAAANLGGWDRRAVEWPARDAAAFPQRHGKMAG